MNKLVKYIIGVAITAIILSLLWYFSNVVAYILVSAVLAIIGKPLVVLLSKFRIRNVRLPRVVIALITLGTIWAVAITFFALFIPLISSNISQLASIDLTKIIASFTKPLESLQSFIQEFFAVKTTTFSIVNSITTQLSSIFNVEDINKFFNSIIGTISNGVVALFSISFITFFFLKEDKLFYQMVISMFPTKYEENVARALESISELLIRYFTGILAESTIVMLVLSTTLTLFGMHVETAFFIGLMVGVLNVVPYIGPLIGGGIGLFIGGLNPIDGMTIFETATVIMGAVLFTQSVDNFLLQPVLYSNRVRAHPLEIFIVILMAGSMAGVLGMLLAIPSYNVIRVFAKEFFNNLKLVQRLTGKM